MSAGESKKILVADEDKDIRFLIQVYLRDFDIELIEARDGEECIELIEKEVPCLVIMNYMLDKLTGYQIAEKIAGNSGFSDIPVIIMTLEGFDLYEERPGVTDFLTKPFDRNQFMNALTGIMGSDFLEKIKRPDLSRSPGVTNNVLKPESGTATETNIGEKKSVLIVDDEPNIIKLLTLILSREYDLDFASTGAELIEKVHQNSYDLIISDVVMPKLSGWKSVKQIREEGYDMPVIFNSGLVKDKELYETLRPGGISRFLLKPFKNKQLLDLVAELIG